jgi:ketol-acid reductoisomerase
MPSERVAVIGAGGKMGSRIIANLPHRGEYELFCSEQGETGLARLRERGIEPLPSEQAVARADFVVLAVPDAGMRVATEAVLPHAPAGAVAILLDPAAAAAGDVYLRDDLNYVVCHPCHPPLFGEQPTDEARRDFFGGSAALQDIVIALMQGPEDVFAKAEALCRAIFAPVKTAHRISVAQMAFLEPTMAEVVAASAAVLMRDALEEAVKAGVPREAATAFMLGHVQIALAIVFGAISSPFSDAANIAIRWGTERVVRSDWRRVFEPDQVTAVIKEMLHPEQRI